MKKVFLNQRGSAMVYALLMFLVVMVIIPSVFMLTESHLKTNNLYATSIENIHVADAGVNYYLWALNKGDEIDFVDESNNLVVFSSGDGRFTVDVLQAHDASHKIRVKGWHQSSPDKTREIEVEFSKRSFTKYSYVTENEGSDIRWTSNDIVYGDLHTNGDFLVDGDPIFFGRVTHTGTYTKLSGNPEFKKGREPVPEIMFPANNTIIKQWADNDGYTYEGRTLIHLVDNKIHTRNPNRNGGNVEIRDIPPSGVIYVNGTTTDNFQVHLDSRFNLDRGNAFVSGTLSGQLTIAAADSIFITDRDPTNYSYSNATVTGGLKYKDTSFTHNTTTGEVTVTNPEKDMLGLIANNSIWILTGGWPQASGNPPRVVMNVAPPNIEINAAMFAIRHVFGNESATSHQTSRPVGGGNAFVHGSIIMNTRHTMAYAYVDGSGFRGYYKNYTHDPRMSYMTPPKFIEPVNSGWEITYWKEN